MLWRHGSNSGSPTAAKTDSGFGHLVISATAALAALPTDALTGSFIDPLIHARSDSSIKGPGKALPAFRVAV